MCIGCVDSVHMWMHNAQAMKDADRQRVADWITQMKGDRTGEVYAADVTAVTGWAVDRSRLSKYANASIPIGREVIEHLSDYARKKGFLPLDLTPPVPPLSLEERAVIAAERQADAIEQLVTQLQEMRGERNGAADAQMSALALIAKALGAQLPEGTGAGAAQRSQGASAR